MAKKRHAARRILQPEMMNVLAQLIRPSGQLVLASDDPTAAAFRDSYVNHNFGQHAAQLIGASDLRTCQRPAMIKAEKAFRRPSWFIFERRG